MTNATDRRHPSNSKRPEKFFAPRPVQRAFASSLLLARVAALGLIAAACSRFETSSPASETSPTILVVAIGDSLTRGANPKNPANTGIKGYVPSLQTLLGSGYEILNCGIGGQTSRDGEARFYEILSGQYASCTLDTVDSASTAAFYDYSQYTGRKPDIVLTWFGGNNLLKNTPSQMETLLTFKNFARAAKLQGTQIFFLTNFRYGSYNPPTFKQALETHMTVTFDRAATLNNIIDQVAAELSNVRVLDMDPVIGDNILTLSWDNIHLNATANQMVAATVHAGLISNVGKTLFQNRYGSNSCITPQGNRVAEGVAICNCDSLSTGALSLCQSGTLTPLITLGSDCRTFSDEYLFLKHHCL